MIEKIKGLFDCFLSKAETLARKRLGEYIAKDAYWFSENPEVMRAFQVLGNQISNSYDGVYSVSNVRDSWREQIKKTKQEEV